MKNLFISQPMNGKTKKEILAERDRAMIQAAKRIGEPVFVLDSVLNDSPEGVNRPLWCLGRSLQIMAEADVAYFTKGWDKARGCRIEHMCADEYGMVVVEEEAE